MLLLAILLASISRQSFDGAVAKVAKVPDTGRELTIPWRGLSLETRNILVHLCHVRDIGSFEIDAQRAL